MALTTIEKWARKTGDKLENSILAIKIELFSGIIEDTRVDTGRARGNWQTDNNRPILSTTERLDKNSSGSLEEMIGKVTPDGLDIMTNNLPYIGVLEEMDGMVAKNMARVATNVRRNV